MYSAEIQAEYTMVKWALCSLPFIVPFFIGNYLYISSRYKPASGQKLDVSFLEERQKALGPWKREEKIMGVIMILTVLSWVLKSVTNIPEYATALIALCATLIFGILPVKQWRNNVAWESLIFIACSVGLGTVLPHVNITTWLSEAVGPYTVGFFSNPFLLIAGLAVLTLLVRFLILSEIGYLSVFTALLDVYKRQAPLPAVLCLLPEAAPAPIPGLKQVMAARKKPVAELSAEALVPGTAAGLKDLGSTGCLLYTS